MQRDHRDAVSSQYLVQRIAVIGAIADQILRLGFDHVEVEAELHAATLGEVNLCSTCLWQDREVRVRSLARLG